MRTASIPARAPAVPLRSRRLLAIAGDGRLVEQVRRGNEAAFEVIFERHGPAILAFCRHMLGTREEAEDAVQHTFAAAYRDLQRGRDRDIALKPWLFAIARNRCLSVLRARREVPTAVDALESGSPPGAGLAEQVEGRADLRHLLADVRELPDEQRAALLLTELGYLSHTEVAGVLGCEVSRVKGLVYRARSALIARREARETPCESIREQLANLRGGSLRRNELRLHLRECPGCRSYREQVKQQRRMLAAALPVAPTLGLKSSVLAAVVESERPATPSPPATQQADGAHPPARRAVDGGAPGVGDSGRTYAADRGAGRDGRGADRVAKRALEQMPRGRGRGPIDHATKVAPVRRGPPAKPWKGERGADAAPRGQANGHAKGAPGPKAGAKAGSRANGRTKPAGNSNGSAKASPKPAPGSKSRSKAGAGRSGRLPGRRRPTPLRRSVASSEMGPPLTIDELLLGWSVRGLPALHLDGLPTTPGGSARQSFFRMGELILEVVEAPAGTRLADDDESLQALHRAIDLGLNFIDTALAYGEGRSERLVGQVVREREETVHVATKVPPRNPISPAEDGAALDEVFPPGYVRECAEQSLRNLEMDAVEVIYNVFDQSPEDELLPACREHDVGVIARVPLDEGGLTGRIDADTEFEGDDFRAHYFRGDRKREVHERATAIATDIAIDDRELAEAALRFILSEPAVSTVIPGMRSLRNVQRNVAASDAGPLTPDERERLRAHRWVRNFYE